MKSARFAGLLAALTALSACGDSTSAPTDASPDTLVVDSSSDSAPDGSAGPCANAPAYKGDSAWTYQATATAKARYCAFNSGANLDEIIQRRLQLFIVPGNYGLPDAPGNETLTLPLCIRSAPDNASTPAGDGDLTVTFEDFLGDTMKKFRMSQPLMLEGATWTIKISADVLHVTSQSLPIPELLLDEQLVHGTNPDSTVSYRACQDPGCNQQLELYPCGEPPAGSNPGGLTFARGSVSFSTTVIGGFAGPSQPAALLKAEGTLDGTPFTQTDYYKLAHQPDHHNKGGGFLVLFDQPIGNACGLKIHIPSEDGSFFFQQLEGWTLDCSGQQLDALVFSTP